MATEVKMTEPIFHRRHFK